MKEDLQDFVSKALEIAFSLGQKFWQQADSDFDSDHKKSNETEAKFHELVNSVRKEIAKA